MKKFLTILFAGVTSLAIAQDKIELSRSIDDNGTTLRISIKGTLNGKRIDYQQTFDVDGMSKGERMELRERILDSLGMAKVEAPVRPVPPVPPTGTTVSISGGQEPVVSATDQFAQSYAVGGDRPYTKQIKYNPDNGQMYMRYRFNKNDEEFSYEKTLDASGKSEDERLRIIRDFERQIGVPIKTIQ
ncbi:hypothetical protein DYBT9275_03173 [Dyadobacter sp. CECT 9275]|uniref:Uncharacterized protein n=1 Tax=Dyadobacter helix TaxID=2822344 RepID=A0A916NCR3_9BACT|nr:hypothetical protein [Dyadobacter sp. CECT 9275]CAG5003533.1 hypothetical protein DYBT9275_03173 [Dyadobacter sp. CECT 9275]